MHPAAIRTEYVPGLPTMKESSAFEQAQRFEAYADSHGCTNRLIAGWSARSSSEGYAHRHDRAAGCWPYGGGSGT